MPKKIEQDTCATPGCERPRRRKGTSGRRDSRCSAHHQRLRNHGDELADIPVIVGLGRQLLRPETAKQGQYGSGSVRKDGYLRMYAPDHPLADAYGSVLAHRMVLFNAIGWGTKRRPIRCVWNGCGGRPLRWTVGFSLARDRLQVDHLNGIKTDNDLSNLVPACNSCNTRRGHGEVLFQWEPDDFGCECGKNFRNEWDWNRHRHGANACPAVPA